MKYIDYINDLTYCPFCQFESKRILLENKHAYLTYAIAPYHKYHLLVIPKQHTDSITNIEWDINVCITSLVTHALKALDSIGHNDCNIVGRNGNVKGKSVRHFHYNIIPGGQISDISLDAEVRSTLSKAEQDALVDELIKIVSNT